MIIRNVMMIFADFIRVLDITELKRLAIGRKELRMNRIVLSIGLILMAIGVSCADSECLLIPTISVITGALLMYFGSKENIKN